MAGLASSTPTGHGIAATRLDANNAKAPQTSPFQDKHVGDTIDEQVADISEEEEKAPAAEKEAFLADEWLEPIAHFFGFTSSWMTKPGQTYNDNYVYRLNPSKRRTPKHRKCDAELTDNGKELVKLNIQGTTALRRFDNSTWQRHDIADVSSTLFQISRIPDRSRITAAQKWNTSVSWLVFTLNWILAFSALTVWIVFLILRYFKRLCIPKRKPDEPQTYLSFYCDNTRYARIAASVRDNRKPEHQNTSADEFARSGELSYRRFRPRMLVKRNGDGSPQLVIKPPVDAKYVFIAFAFRHFPTLTAAGKPTNEAIELSRVANKMAGKLGCEYFWCCVACDAKDGTVTDMLDIDNRGIYEISDTIRGAEHVIIVLPATDRSVPTPRLAELTVSNHPVSDAERAATHQRLKEWAARIWTFPEVILGPDKKIRVCWKEGKYINWYELEKKQFPAEVWDDTETSRQLVEHYGNTSLSRLEFVKIALECLIHRGQKKEVKLHYHGDISYVLMGFLRLRPIVNCHDSSLQAFARLSLPADNDKLMERFICIQPPNRNSSWARMEDEFHASLWNIEPSIQISGVGENDTLIIEKARGAKIQLNKFSDICAARVGFMRHFEGVLAGFAVLPSWSDGLARNYRRAKFRNVYPRLFGFEGFMSIREIEDKLFGAPVGLLSWSKNASPLSRHGPGPEVLEAKMHWSDSDDIEQGQLEGYHQYQGEETGTGAAPTQPAPRDSVDVIVDGVQRVKTYPMIGKEPWGPCDTQCQRAAETGGRCSHPTEEQLREMGSSPMGEDKVFTLIDTLTMTVTIFKAAWPPQALIVCGSEGGMERVLACSYDWTSGTFFKEAVLKFPGRMLDSMHRLPAIRLGLRRQWQGHQVRR